MDRTIDSIYKSLEEGVELPNIKGVDVQYLDALLRARSALPRVLSIDSDKLRGFNSKEIDAAKYAQELGLAFADNRANLNRSELIARKKSLAIDRYFKALETQYRNRLALLSRSNQRNKNLFMRRFAGELLGVSSELYKIIR
jgi:hypothetical protein